MLVLLLGAGFSCYAGLPTMAKFGGVYDARSTPINNAANSQICGAHLLQTAGHTFALFRKYCQRSLSFIDIDANNLEELFCAAEAMQEAKFPNVALDDGPKPIQELIDDLSLWTWNVYQGLPDYFGVATGAAVSKRYDSFMKWLMPHRDQLAVLTTNYDVLFETLVIRKDTCVRYPFSSNPLWVNHEEKSFLSDSNQSIHLCKLHGSVSYFFGDDRHTPFVCSEIARKGDPPYGRSINVDRHTPLPAVVRLGTFGALRKRHPKLVPAIIAPTYAKLHEMDWLRQTWNEATTALRSARVLVIVGYSFPSTDGFMRAMLLAAMAQRESDAPLHVMLVSPDKEAWARVNQLFLPLIEKGRLAWRACKFEDWSPADDHKLASWLAGV